MFPSRLLGAVAAATASVALMGEAPVDPDALSRLVVATSARTAPVRAYTFALHVDVALKTFPYLHFGLEGNGKYARPNRYSVHFRRVPWFGKGFEDVSLDALDPSTWPAHYAIESVERDNGRLVVSMKDKVKSPLAGIRAELDDAGLRRIVWSYTYGGRIAVELTPSNVDGFPLPAREDAEITMPGYHVFARARFDGYKVEADGTPEPAPNAPREP